MTETMLVYGADKGVVEQKLKTAGTTVQQILTGLVVIVGICVSLWIIIKRMPNADDPHEKSEVWKAVGRVMALVALSAAIVWLLPWVYSLFV
ncbi:conjugal transfer protein [Streptococcus iniae]|nr:conjugal transfer protein [Streptococcus iniae]